MTSTPMLFPLRACIGLTPKEHYLEVAEHEHETTLRVLRAYPDDALDLQPSDKGYVARDLAHVFVREQRLLHKALTTGIDWSAPPPQPPEPPATIAGMVEELEEERGNVLDLVRDMDEADLADTVEFMIAPYARGEVMRLDFLWMVLYDEIHHRGQLSVYLRLAGAKVPSIYGPTADEAWL